MFLFENSLRKNTPSPIPRKHSSCKGVAHGSGSYGSVEEKECDSDKSPFQRNNSKRWSGRAKQVPKKSSETTVEGESQKAEEVKKSLLQRNGSGRWSFKSSTKKAEKKATSVSSDNFSESDSLESIGDKTKNFDNTDDTNKKDVCNRLYNGVTIASIAKTAKMRHLDIFDVDENVWVGGLRKTSSSEEADKKQKQKNLNEIENIFDKSRLLTLRRKGPHDNGFQDFLTSKPRIFHREGLKNRSFREKNSSKIKQKSYEEILFMSVNKKTPGFFYVVDKNDCFKDINEILLKKEVQVSCREE